MSTTRNTDAVSNQMPGGGSGEFHSKIERDEPLTTHGHKPGVLVGNDAAPEFSAKTLPPGSAPADRTFKPNNASDIPPSQQYRPDSEIEADAPQASASDTLGGATSGEVHTGIGKPIQGQSSKELHHDGQSGRKGQSGGGLEGLASGVEGSKTVDAHDPQFAGQRAMDKDEAVIGRGNVGGAAAQDREPESATTVATENKLGRN
ncbi:hypothetical protein BAUCODRAFT_27538 [Baudoinia panamericana UAMH 10762]|uniref:Uncharacterized protein n=1 Tax=Baudoinia panamericana (strain UAMH 10762) TaxID=717646 RepID=M2MZV5_BAUPA|nr:uncharacterized protein BAUCODRAFT_27538 [Baudoinia panamericana UAMH 10762]EMC92209.1 hypothetical protein BAUCODRAFT_27538 [Baudoinia panamericana UAMH 10762]